MHFENYPHDEQICRLSMESCKLIIRKSDMVFVIQLALQFVGKWVKCKFAKTLKALV